jgi:hypothetical protein
VVQILSSAKRLGGDLKKLLVAFRMNGAYHISNNVKRLSIMVNIFFSNDPYYGAVCFIFASASQSESQKNDR